MKPEATGGQLTSRLLSALILCALSIPAGALALTPAQASGTSSPTWSTPVEVTQPATLWFGVDLEIGQNGMYVLSTIYNYGNGGPLYLMKSTDGGATWSSSTPLYGNEGGMCVYTENGRDVILLTDGYDVAKSVDGGVSWSNLAPPGNYWRAVTIGTNSSWLGSPDDGSIYVIGSVWGSSQLDFTKSADGGMTWSSPIMLAPDGGWARITSDGSKLYVVYEIAGNHAGVASLVTKSSSDWGITWSAEKVLVPNDGSSYIYTPYGFQTLDSQKALLTYLHEPTDSGNSISSGNYGYYWFSNETYQPVGSVSGPEWMLHEGFSGVLRNNTLSVAWPMALEDNNAKPPSEIMFAQSDDTGLANSTPPAEPGVRINSGTAPVKWNVTADSNSVWMAEVQNHGLMALHITVSDETGKKSVNVLRQQIIFDSADAVVTTNAVNMKQGHTYEIIAQGAGGPNGTYALVQDGLSASTSSILSDPVDTMMTGVAAVLAVIVVMAFWLRFIGGKTQYL